jgi:hypothetical protein
VARQQITQQREGGEAAADQRQIARAATEELGDSVEAVREEGSEQGGGGPWVGGEGEEKIGGEGADHEDLAVGEVDQANDAVHHGVAEGDERVEAAELDGIDQRAREEGAVEALADAV